MVYDIVLPLIKKHEGTGPMTGGRYFPYTDTVGKLTIGYGRNMTDKGFSQQEVDLMLFNDLTQVALELRQALPWYERLDDVRKAVLLDMGYNLGVLSGNPPKLLTFKNTLAAIERGDYATAAKNMLASKWAQQVGNRAVDLAEMMLHGKSV